MQIEKQDRPKEIDRKLDAPERDGVPRLLRQTSAIDTPISRYSTVQTTGNSHAGGASGGCRSCENASISPLVSTADSAPTASAMAAKAT